MSETAEERTACYLPTCLALFRACESAEERRVAFFALVLDEGIPRPAILLAMKQLGIRDDMSLELENELG